MLVGCHVDVRACILASGQHLVVEHLLLRNELLHVRFHRFNHPVLALKLLLGALNEPFDLEPVLHVAVVNLDIIYSVKLRLVGIGYVHILRMVSVHLRRILARHEQVLVLELLAMMTEVIVFWQLRVSRNQFFGLHREAGLASWF